MRQQAENGGLGTGTIEWSDKVKDLLTVIEAAVTCQLIDELLIVIEYIIYIIYNR